MITILKLSNGIEVVGELCEEDSLTCTLDKPLQINYRYAYSLIPSISFVRYIMFADSELVKFKRSDVMHEVTAREAFANYYADVVDTFYEKAEKVVDAELVECLSSTTQEKHMHDILEMMPIEGLTVN